MSTRTTARTIGALFVLATATAIAGGLLVAPTEEADALTAAAAAPGAVVTGVLLELVLVLSVVGIGAVAYPVLRREDPGLALGYAATRLLEGVLLLAATLSSVVVLELGRDGVADSGGLVALLVETRSSSYLLGALVMLGVSTVVFNALLLRGRLVPRWLSTWGLVAGVLIATRGVVELSGVEPSALLQAVLAAPIALQEMVLAGWLIVRGFDTPSLAGGLHARTGGMTVDVRIEEGV